MKEFKATCVLSDEPAQLSEEDNDDHNDDDDNEDDDDNDDEDDDDENGDGAIMEKWRET